MWKSGTRHVSMARATYLARPIAMSSCGDSFPVKKFILTPFSQIRCPLTSEKPDDVEGAPGMIAASFKAMVDSSDLDRATAGELVVIPKCRDWGWWTCQGRPVIVWPAAAMAAFVSTKDQRDSTAQRRL